MANEQELFGMPQIIINFRTKGTTAIKRSARGIVAMILHNEVKDEIHNYTIRDVSDIPDTGLTDENVDLIKKCLLGTPLRILVYTLPNTNVYEDPGQCSQDADQHQMELALRTDCFGAGTAGPGVLD